MKWMTLVLIFILITSTQFSISNFDQANAAKIDCWALIIGISDYESQNDLRYAHPDANDMEDVLINYHNWPESHIYKLINSSATKSNILDHIIRIDSQEDSDDLFLFFFAGHGSQGVFDQLPYDEADGMDEYLIPYDCTGDTDSALRDDELQEALDNLESSKKVVILDTCFSGGIARGTELQIRSITLNDSAGASARSIPAETSTRDLDKDGYVTLTSCDEYELAAESSDLENGVFTYYLIEGLGSGYPADSNSNSMVSAEEAFAYANPRTTAFIPDQHPQIYDWISGDVELETVITIQVTDSDLDFPNAAEGDVHFLYPNFEGVKPSGVIRALLSDWTAMGYLIGMCQNIQNEVTDTDDLIVDTDRGAVKLQGKTFVLTGGPVVNGVVHYYENNRVAPVYWKNVKGVNYWYEANGNRIDETALSFSQIDDGQDMFVVESFIDNEDNKFLVIYGYGWKGTFAGGKFFKFIMYPNIDIYNDSYYVFRWIDENNNGFVELEEISDIPVVYG